MPEQRWLRIIPAALITYTIAYIDRVNVSMALPSLSRDLHMDSAQAGNVAGIFFWGYLLLQIPGGHIANRWSAKTFISIPLVRVGSRGRRLRTGPELARTLDHAPFVRDHPGRSILSDSRAHLPLVSARRTSTRERIVDGVRSNRPHHFVAALRLDSGPLELASHVGIGGCPAFRLVDYF